jgi:hypothetical protein
MQENGLPLRNQGSKRNDLIRKRSGTGKGIGMSDEGSRGGKIRMTLDVTPEMKRVIDDLASREGDTQASVMRRAIALLKTIKEAEKKGESPALIDQNGHVTARLVGV